MMNVLGVLLVVVPLACGQILGGSMKVDVNRSDVQKMATEAMSMLNQKLGTQNSVVRVISAYTQVVAGTNYFLSLEVQTSSGNQICHITVWSRPWLNDDQITDHVCSARAKRAIPGGQTPLLGGTDPAHLSLSVQEAVHFAEDMLNAKSNNMYRQVAQSVDHVTSQIVSGTKYTFDLHLVQSTCRNNDASMSKGINECPATTGQVVKTCYIEIVDQPWENIKYHILSDSCTMALSTV